MADGCWNSLYLNNHDQPRMVSRFGDDGVFRVESAKLLATLLHTLQGTPYIYQGEELGMTNLRLDSIEDCRDVDTLNHYREATQVYGQSPEAVMEAIRAKGRDNARSPMQWDHEQNAGFTTGVPWLAVNPNYTEINAAAALRDPDSVFHYYKALIRLRKQHSVIVYGGYTPLCQEHPTVWAYRRDFEGSTLFTVLNFSAERENFSFPRGTLSPGAQLLIGNYSDSPAPNAQLTLRPYEAVVYLSQASAEVEA